MSLPSAKLKLHFNLESILSRVWEFLVWVIVLTYIVPGTIAERTISHFTNYIQGNLGFLANDGHFRNYDLACNVGYGLLVCLLISYLLTNNRVSRYSRFGKAMVLFASLYVISFFLKSQSANTNSDLLAEMLWPTFTFGVFFAIILFFNYAQSIRLIKFVIIILTIQSLYAICYHLLHINQFHTPHFGDRTSGTFGNPGLLYPLCLLGIPISLTFAIASKSKLASNFYLLCSICMLFALIFTYMRSGWIALGCSLIWMITTRSFGIKEHVWKKVVLFAVACVCLLGACTIRTPNSHIGNKADRSFWGRTAIWQVAFKSIEQHPLYGAGLNTYGAQQNTFITHRLRDFNPRNVDAESLILNICVEFGFIGLILFGSILWQFVRLCYYSLNLFSNDQQEHWIMIGVASGGLGIIVAGFFDTPVLTDRQAASTLILYLLIACVYKINSGDDNSETTHTLSISNSS